MVQPVAELLRLGSTLSGTIIALTIGSGGAAIGFGVWVRSRDIERADRLRAASERVSRSGGGRSAASQPYGIVSPWLAGVPSSWATLDAHPLALRLGSVLGGAFVHETDVRLRTEPAGEILVSETGNLAARIAAGQLMVGAGVVVVMALTGRWALVAPTVFTGSLVAVLGSRAPAILASRWLKRRAEVAMVELPVLIDTISLCTRAGMSFDQALELYCERFSGLLAVFLDDALALWRSGLTTRSRELEHLGARLAAPMVEGFFSAVIQSIDLGTPLAAALDAQAAEVRAQRQSRVEEKIAKLPVKMLIPIGLFTLPAMLLLLLAPIGLQVVAGMG